MFVQTILTFAFIIAAASVIARRIWNMAFKKDGKSCGSCTGCSAPNSERSLTVTPLVQLGSGMFNSLKE